MSERLCREAGCGQPHLARDLCAKHYRAWRATQREASPCSVPGCDRPAHVKTLCRGHYARQQRGRPVETPLHKYDRETKVLVCRVPADTLARLREQAAARRTTSNRLAAELLTAAMSGKGSPA